MKFKIIAEYFDDARQGWGYWIQFEGVEFGKGADYSQSKKITLFLGGYEGQNCVNKHTVEVEDGHGVYIKDLGLFVAGATQRHHAYREPMALVSKCLEVGEDLKVYPLNFETIRQLKTGFSASVGGPVHGSYSDSLVSIDLYKDEYKSYSGYFPEYDKNQKSRVETCPGFYGGEYDDFGYEEVESGVLKVFSSNYGV